MPPTEKPVRIRVSDDLGTLLEDMAMREHRHPGAQMLYILEVTLNDWDYLQQRDFETVRQIPAPQVSELPAIEIEAEEKPIAGRWPLATIRVVERMARSSHRSFNGQVEYMVEIGLRYWDALLERVLTRRRAASGRGDEKTPSGSGSLARLS